MDQRGEKEEHSSHDAVAAAAAVPEGVHGESFTDQRDDGGYEAESAGVIKEQVELVDEEEASAPLLARPCSLLQLLLRACAGCLVSLLHGYCMRDSNDPKPAAAAAVVAESSPQEWEGGDDDKAAAGSSSEAATQVLPPPPGPPQEGNGGPGGSHNSAWKL